MRDSHHTFFVIQLLRLAYALPLILKYQSQTHFQEVSIPMNASYKSEYILKSPDMGKIILTVICLLAGVAGNADKPVVARLTRYDVKQGHDAEFRAALTEIVSTAIRLEGNMMAEAYQEENKPSVLWLIERWSSAKELEKFAGSRQSKALQALLQTALTEPPKDYHLTDLEPLTKKQWRAAPGSKDQPLTVMLFVDARAGTQQQFKDTYHIAMPKFRGEAGVVTYQLSEIEGDGTQFVTYEKFRSRDAFQYHLNFPPVKPVIEYLESNVKQPPFQNGLHNLVEIAPLTRE